MHPVEAPLNELVSSVLETMEEVRDLVPSTGISRSLEILRKIRGLHGHVEAAVTAADEAITEMFSRAFVQAHADQERIRNG